LFFLCAGFPFLRPALLSPKPQENSAYGKSFLEEKHLLWKNKLGWLSQEKESSVCLRAQTGRLMALSQGIQRLLGEIYACVILTNFLPHHASIS